MKELIEREDVKKALVFLREDDGRTLEEQLEMCQIPAPSHQEKEKAEYVLRKFEEIGLENAYMDEVWNVFGTIQGRGEGPKILLAAHTDTVFPMETDLTVRQEGKRYYCPGINDDTRSVAELLTIARAMKRYDIHGEGDIVFCANVCEEGLGDLKGVKYIFQNLHDYDGFVSIDNPVLGGIVYTATGSNRFEVTFHGMGGHSFSHFGTPSAIHAMGRAIAKIAELEAPLLPKTTFNVGVVHGGTSINTVAESASMLVDIRSDSPEELERLTGEMREAVERAVSEENEKWAKHAASASGSCENMEKAVRLSKKLVSAEITLKGKRPAGTQDETCRIVQAAWEATECLGIQPELRDESSTDANIPISMGIPAITVGRGGNEGGVHTVHEWFEPVDAYLGPQKNMLIVLALSGMNGFRKYQLEKWQKPQD